MTTILCSIMVILIITSVRALRPSFMASSNVATLLWENNISSITKYAARRRRRCTNGLVTRQQQLRHHGANTLLFVNNDDRKESLPSSSETTPVPAAYSKDFFVLSFDGVIANTARQRAELALEVALHIWPHLQGLLLWKSSSSNKDDTTTTTRATRTEHGATEEWLLNKMIACACVTRGSNYDGLLGCDEVMLARLLLEEQALDEKKSVGKKGKYASKYHPSSIHTYASDDDDDEEEGAPFHGSTKEKNRSGSRPLTVGEICANWSTGGCLRDTLRTRYNVCGKDPIPRIREDIQTRLHQKAVDNTIVIHPCVKEALLGCSGKNVYILIRHTSYVKHALEVLSSLNIPIALVDTGTDVSSAVITTSTTGCNSGITILVGCEQETHVDLMEHLMKQARDDSDFFILHSSTTVLHDAKHLLNGESPYTMKAARHTRIGNNISMALFLPTWSDCLKQFVDAEMDPWLTVIDETEFLELLSATLVEVSY